MKGGKILVQGKAGDYLGQEMSGGGIIAAGCRDYAFRNMRGGYGVVRGDAGKFAGLGNSGGRIVVPGELRREGGMADALRQPLRAGRCRRLPGASHERRQDCG